MVASSSLSQGASSGVPKFYEILQLTEFAGDMLCRHILARLCQRAAAGTETSILDLHQLTGLALKDVFTALRTLEHDRILDIIDNPSDPFGARLRVRSGAIDILAQRAATRIRD